MIEEVIKEIKVAEEEAAKVKKEAEEFSAQLSKKSETDCLDIISRAEAMVKLAKKAGKAEALKASDEVYDQAIEKARGEAEDLLKKVDDKIERLSKKIAESIVNGNC